MSPTTVTKIQRNRLGRGVKCKGWENSANIALYLENGMRRLAHTNRKSQVANRSLSVPVTLNDLERRDMKGQTSVDDLKYAATD